MSKIIESKELSSASIIDGFKVSGNSYFDETITSMGNVMISGNLTTDGPLTTESLVLNDSGSDNAITVSAPSLSANYTLTLPTDTGNSGQVLVTMGASGELFWATAAATPPSYASISRTTAISNWMTSLGQVSDVVFETVDFTQGTDITATTAGFTINTTAKYLLTVSIPVTWNGGDAGLMLYAQVGAGTPVLIDSFRAKNGSDIVFSSNIVLDLNATDNLVIRGKSYTVFNATSLSISAPSVVPGADIAIFGAVASLEKI